MPDSVETPAPPKKTILSLSSSHCFKVSIASDMLLTPLAAVGGKPPDLRSFL